MCGIIAVYSLGKRFPYDREICLRMVQQLRHRGPDAGGYWQGDGVFLGHRRLSIIGLADGAQPMFNATGRYAIVFNGEIYNYKELKVILESMGHIFRTSSDTEVLLEGYARWGKELPNRIRGMFSFAIYDRLEDSIFVARDRFGEKPLFVASTGSCVAFSSEIGPLLSLDGVDLSIDEEALYHYALLNYVPGIRSLCRGICRLEPGSWACYSRTEKRSGYYWKVSDVRLREVGSFEESVEALEPLLNKAVARTLTSDVPVSIFLSGGIDSSLIADAAFKMGRLEKAFCLDFEESSHSEFPAAEAYAMQLGLPIERVVLTHQALDHFEEMVAHADDPLADSSSLAVWTISDFASRSGSKVVLGGDGGDELFGGYLTYKASAYHARYISRMPLFLKRGLESISKRIPTSDGKVSLNYKLWRFLRAASLPTPEAHLSWNGTWLPEDVATFFASSQVCDCVRGGFSNVVPRGGRSSGHLLSDLQQMDLTEYLPNDILAKTDRMSMAHGLEVRAPFLDLDLAEWAISLPWAIQNHKGNLKAILREAMRRRFGAPIANRPKQGFSIPVHAWMRGSWSCRLKEYLHYLDGMGVFNMKGIMSVFDQHQRSSRDFGFELWGLAVLAVWHEKKIRSRVKERIDLSDLIEVNAPEMFL